jgi:hypothetical protein
MKITMGLATEIYNQNKLSYRSLDTLHSFLNNYGHSRVIDCLKEMAREAICRGEAADFLFADRAAYFARGLKNRDYLENCDIANKLSEKITLRNEEIDDISSELREVHARFSYIWHKIVRLVEPQYFPDERGNQIRWALGVDWGIRDKIDISSLETILCDFLDDVLQRADLAPEKRSFHCAWILVPGAYLEFSELADVVPELKGETKKIVELLVSKEKLMSELDYLRWDYVFASKKASDHFSSMQNIIYAVGLDNLALQLDKVEMAK